MRGSAAVLVPGLERPLRGRGFGGLAAANENEIGWSAKRVGDGLEVSVAGYGTVVLTGE